MTLPGRDIPWKVLLKALGQEWKQDKVTDMAASLTFFGVLALFPFLLFLVAVFGLVLKPDQVDQLVQHLAQLAPGDVTRILGGQIRAIQQSQSGGLVTIGILGAIWSASGGMVSLIASLNGVYDVEDERPFWKVRGLALVATLGASIALLAAALVAIAAAPVANAIGGPIGTAILWLRLPVAGLVMMLVWALLYYGLPDVEQKFQFITPGTIFGVVVWVIASWGFSFYVSHFGSYNKTYGAIGGVIVMLMWMWISAIVVLLGAEINATIEHLSPEGKRTGAKSLADAGADVPKGLRQIGGYGLERRRKPERRRKASFKKLAMGTGLALLFNRRHRHA